jgi:hypothetical protein
MLINKERRAKEDQTRIARSPSAKLFGLWDNPLNEDQIISLIDLISTDMVHHVPNAGIKAGIVGTLAAAASIHTHDAWVYFMGQCEYPQSAFISSPAPLMMTYIDFADLQQLETIGAAYVKCEQTRTAIMDADSFSEDLMYHLSLSDLLADNSGVHECVKNAASALDHVTRQVQNAAREFFLARLLR